MRWLKFTGSWELAEGPGDDIVLDCGRDDNIVLYGGYLYQIKLEP
jgi:hypothetical protein